ncbi:LOB domain-containing protein 2 [Macadamia integrifolia]|uniref:LOB domain-containing protein 2 n=1 Tax=Macadamia integrifolia TaxID=60698 RepID=UPI001C532F35|nr:LOB domain-containing protein 2 [Macadamia integrifolia]
MQKSSNNLGLHQACAACKHQRKKCRENCVLAPFFPAEQSQNFQAVHRVFGVSNVQKIVRSLASYDQRVKAVESLIWEANWRQKDPILGCYGEYKKVMDELRCLKAQLQISIQVPDHTMMYKQPPSSGFVGWNSNVNGIGQIGMGHVGMNNSTNGFNFIRSSNGNMILDSTQYSYVSQVQGEDKFSQGRDPFTIVCPPQSINGINEQYYVADQMVNVKSMDDDAVWDRGS